MKDITEYLLYELEHNSSPEPSVTVIGDLNFDYLYTSPPLEPGREVIIREFTRTLAGAGGYVSCGLARLGAAVHLIARVGGDREGGELVREISGRGVDVSGVLAGPGATPFTLLFTQPGETAPRQAATYLGVLQDFSVHAVEWEHYLEEADLAYSCNYFLMPRLREEIGRVFRSARSHGVLTAYDANAGDRWDQERELKTLKERIYPHTDLIFLNQREARFLTGHGDPERAVEAAHPQAVTAVVKLGERGVLIRHRGRVHRIGGFPPPGPVRDTVGAGDSFQAAFCYFHLRRFPIELCGILGAVNAAASVSRTGGTGGQLDRGGLAALIRRVRVREGEEGITITARGAGS
ncbi:MAG: carbohydrate kinase family protein [Spirochaetota bacterium]